MSEENELKTLRRERDRILKELSHSSASEEKKAAVRKRAFSITVRDIVVQSVGTVLGGATLAFLALVTGAIPRDDPFALIVSGLLTLGALVAILSAYKSTTEPRITSDDLKALENVRNLDAAIKLLQGPEDTYDSQVEG